VVERGDKMFVQTFTKENFFDMDPMHDCDISHFSFEDKTLVITHDNLDEGIVDPNGEPIYKHKKLVIRYEFESYCDVSWRGKKKYGVVDFYKDPDEFYKTFKNHVFTSYKYSIDCFNELSLYIDLYKLKNGKFLRSKFYEFKILLDAKKITYTWE
jgi:hypothetical protein